MAFLVYTSKPISAQAEWGDETIPVGTEKKFTLSSIWGDMDGDGDLDIAVGNYRDVNQIYENRQGVFELYWESPDSQATKSLAWGDMDQDGDLDLAVGNYGSPRQIFRNDQGQFTLAWETTGDSKGTSAVAWVDWNQDGLLDFASANGTGILDPEPNQVFENTGDSFVLVWESPETETEISYSMAWGDWDGDGDLDPVFGNRITNQIYRNNGGDLELVQTISTSGYQTVAIDWGDWDGDGDLDLAFGNQADFIDAPITGAANQIYRNDAGRFVQAWSSAEESITTSVAWGDWDNDGDLDLATGNMIFDDSDEQQGIQLYQNQEGELTLIWSTVGVDSDAKSVAASVAWGDLDSDGDLDLLSGEDFRTNRIYRNGTNAPWSIEPLPDIGPSQVPQMAWGDWDGDHGLDLVVSASGTVHLYTNQAGAFTLAWSLPPEDRPNNPFTPIHSVWGDWNGDGQLDLAISIGRMFAIYENKGDDFSRVWRSPDGQSEISDIAWGDWDDDDDLDLVVGRINSANQVYANSGTDFMLSWEANDSKETYAVAWGDMDSDGDLDLAVGNGKSTDEDGTTFGDTNQIFENIGGDLTLFWASTDLGVSSDIAWGDVDSDGDLDLAVGNMIALATETASERNYLYINRGENFLARPLPGSIKPTTSVAWGDVDGDGDLDLAVGNLGLAAETNNQLFRNDEGILSLVWAGSGITKGSQSVAWGDVDGDGDLDLAAGNHVLGHQLYRNNRVGGHKLVANPIRSSIQQPGITAPAYFYSSAEYVLGPIVTISFTLHGPDLHQLTSIRGYYSLNGGGQWLPATATPETVLKGLATGRLPTFPPSDISNSNFLLFFPMTRGKAITGLDVEPISYAFHWDTAQSGLMGKADNVVFRLDIFSGYGPFQHPAQTIYSLPFRLQIPTQ